MSSLVEIDSDFLKELAIRCFFSSLGSIAAYLVYGKILTSIYPRKVLSRDIFHHDMVWGFASLLWGTPIVQIFFMATCRWGISYGYERIQEYGVMYWALSIPLYLVLWDCVFYFGHRFLHLPVIYRFVHTKHHQCRAPVAWSALCIDPIDSIFEGFLPALTPLLIAPFHLTTVYALNLLLMSCAMWNHTSAKHWSSSKLFLGPKDHNLHHQFGQKNYNFAVLFSIWDRMFGTFNDTLTATWWEGDKDGGEPSTKKQADPLSEKSL